MKNNRRWEQADTGDLRLTDGEVHLWRIMGGEDEVALNEEEENLLSRISLPTVRSQFIASRSGVRRIVSSYLGCRPEDAVIIRSGYAKPAIKEGGHLEFSVSHTGGVVFAAFALMPVGLDVECRARRTRSFMEIARRYYSGCEVDEILRQETDEERQGMFLRYWVHREAMTKLTGEGIAKGMAGAEVCPDWSGLHGGRKVFMAEIGEKEHLGVVAAFREFEVKGWFVL